MYKNTDNRLQNVTNAYGGMEAFKEIKVEQQRQRHLENQQFKQTEELKRQTLILEEARSLTNINAEYTKQALECTLKNQKSSTKQFWASIIIAGASLIVAMLALILK